MKTIPTHVHAIIDYLVGLALLVMPNLFGFVQLGGAAVDVPRILGGIILIQALFTNYEPGLFKVLPMKAHLAFDYAISTFLAISPWLFGFNVQSPRVWMPHVIVGIAAFLVTLMTQREPRRIPLAREGRTVI